MIKKLKLNAYEGAIRTGGFFGWYLTVMFLCQTNAGSAALLEEVNRTFLLFGVITTALILAVMIFIDFEGMLADKYLRWIPGLFMAESGIALCLAEARTMTLFAAIAGVSASIGAIAMISGLLRVKVSQRIFSVGGGLAIGGIVRVVGNLIMNLLGGNVGEIITAVLIGIIAALTVHTAAFSKEAKPPVSRAEAKPSEIFRKIPSVYFWVFVLGCAFMLSFCTIEALCSDSVTLDLAFSNKYYNEIAYIAFAAAAVLSVFTVKPHALASLFAVGSALAVCSAFLLGLRSPTQAEAVVMTVLCFAAYACFKVCMYLIVVTFSLDRPHPLFYAIFGYGVIISAEWLGRVIMRQLTGNTLRTVTAILLVLIPVGGFVISRAMRHSGYSQEQLEKRHRIRQLISRISEEKNLSEREKTMLNLAVLDGYSADMMPDKLGISRNTVKTQIRGLTAKFDASSLDEITENLYKMIDETEEQLRIEEARNAEEKSVLAALAAKDAQAQELFEQTETSESEETVDETAEEAVEETVEENPDSESDKSDDSEESSVEKETESSEEKPVEKTSVKVIRRKNREKATDTPKDSAEESN